MIRFTSLSCSAAKAVCLTDSDVWITTLSQVPFITGYAHAGVQQDIIDRFACYDLTETECSGRNVSATERQDVVCVNILPDPVRENAGIPAVNMPEAASIFLQYGGANITLSNDFEEQTLKRVLLTLRETVC